MREGGLIATLAPVEVGQDVEETEARVGILVAVVGVLVVSLVGVVWLSVLLRPLGEFFDQGLLGPEDQRQRVEVPAHGFVISFADDWVVQTPAPDPLDVEQVGMTAVLTSTAPEGGPVCTIYVAPGGVTTSAERLLKPWMERYGDPGEYWTMGDESALLGAPAGFAYEDDERSASAVWAIPHGDDALVLACVLSEDARNDFADGLWQAPGSLMRVGMPPIVGSIEVLPPSSPAPTPRAPGQGGRVEVPEAGFALTFPEGWTIFEPGTDDFERALARADLCRQVSEQDTVMVAEARPSGQAGGLPVEWCTVDTMIFPFAPLDAWIKWKEDASLEDIDILPLLFVGGEDADRLGITYLEVPAGQAARMDVSDEATYVSIYLLTNGNTFYWISCAGDDPPADRWLTVVESFEFLSEEK